MANLFGSGNVTVYADGQAYTLRLADRGGREEDFIREEKVWPIPGGGVGKRLQGFRLRASYRWSKISSQEMTDLTTIISAAEVSIKMPGLPVRYPVRISAFRRGLADGLSDADAAEIEFTGLERVRAYPNADTLYTMPALFDDAILIIGLQEQ